jgi:enoyl-CoA hydratase/carnithine racemase
MLAEEAHDGGVVLVRLEAQASRNALSPTTLLAIAETLERLDADDEVGCVVLTGTDKAFASGADLRWMAEQTHESMVSYAGGAWPRIHRVGVPLIAAVRGWALGGGCELALHCDMIVAGTDAVFGLPEVTLGLLPGAGGTQVLGRTLTRQLASEIVFTGRRLSAQEAADHGFVNRVTDPQHCVTEALALAREVAQQPHQAVRLAKRAIRAAREMPMQAGLDYERRLFEIAFSTQDHRSARDALLSRWRQRGR